ncbi:MAG: TerD family protein [Candidatus Competibacteraceae bacterium]|nr:TerD family protein [Candidatus Competibacteraceae bacterium]
MGPLRESTDNRFITPGPSGRIDIVLGWQEAPWPLDAVCLALDDDGRLPAQDWFITTERPRSPNGSLEMSPALKRVDFTLEVNRLPPWVKRWVFAASLHGSSGFRGVTEPTVEVIADGVAHLRYPITPPPADSHYRSLIFLELERTPRDWQIHALPNPRDRGLDTLAESFQPTTAAAAPPPAPSPTTIATQGAAIAEHRAPGRKSGGKGLLLWLILLLTISAGIWLYRNPTTVEDLLPARLDKPPGQPPSADCQIDSDELYRRYHRLGENYSTIRTLLEDSDQTLAAIRQQVRQGDYQCSRRFIDSNRQEIERLQSLALEAWQREAVGLGICAGKLNNQLETQIAREDRTTVLQRLVNQADRARALESDLINIARELAYFRNKAGRLIEDYQTAIEACTF